MKKAIYIISSALIVLTSCSDALIADDIEATWQLETYLRNDLDETSSMKISDYEETYHSDGTFSRSYIDGNQEPVEETGEYSINEDNSTIHISDVSSISEFSDAHSTLSTSTIDVLAVDKSEYVYTFENGGDKHEFRFLIKE